MSKPIVLQPDGLDPNHGPTKIFLAAEYWQRECLKARAELRSEKGAAEKRCRELERYLYRVRLAKNLTEAISIANEVAIDAALKGGESDIR